MNDFHQSPEPHETDQPYETDHPSSEVELLLKYLADHDARCPVCQYNLRHLTAPRCPECGRAIKLTIGTTDPYLLPWILTLVAAALPAGVGVVVLIGVIANLPGILRGVGLPRFEDIPPCISVLYCVVCVPCVLLLIQSRRKFWRLTALTQKVWAAIFIAVDIALLIELLLMMFSF